MNPLWTPPWHSIEPSVYGPARTPLRIGRESKLLAGIMGHNVCLDIFGGPSDGRIRRGDQGTRRRLRLRLRDRGIGRAASDEARASAGRTAFERTIELRRAGVRIRESVENLSATDRPIGWTQHVSLGPPFLEKGETEFRMAATRSKVFESAFGMADYLQAGAEFDWPMAPLATEGYADLRVLNSAPSSSAFTTHLMDPAREDAFFAGIRTLRPGLRLCVEARRFSLAGHLGRELQPHARAVERQDAGARDGVRRVADAGDRGAP